MMSIAQKPVKAPLHPVVVLLIALVLPGVGQVVNNTPSRGLMMLFFMLMLGVITFNLAGPEISVVGKFSGGLFIYALSVIDAYYWARYRWERFRRGV
ncbi:MAG TPA: hypothetical protein VGK14_13705 [Novimethylophilus sp.]|jgi:hypothetical protein|uniref:hypothetical protein n=1 Tax=Novimethylophilus sp. TaxID=2137426 RepID=UPI002F42B9B1